MDYRSISTAIQAAEGIESAKMVAAQLVEAYIQKWEATDRRMVWSRSESEFKVSLAENTVLVGRIDGEGVNEEGQPFIAEFKSANPRKQKTWKSEWLLSPQGLTYGLASALLDRPAAKLLVRTMFKTTPPKPDFEWFTYSQRELAFWMSELMGIADEIRARRRAEGVPWRTNFTYCLRYGEKYPCPFYALNCSQLAFNNVVGYQSRIPHLRVEQEIRRAPTNGSPRPEEAPANDLVVLDATRVEDFINCPEKYRMGYEANLAPVEQSEALVTGTLMHLGLKTYYDQLIKEQATDANPGN